MCSVFPLDFEHVFVILMPVSRTSVRRLAVLGSLTAALTVGVLSVAAGAGSADGHQSGPASRAYVIRAGDTVWSIAERIVGPEGDPRPVVDAILSSNGVPAGSLVPGQVLLIPRVSAG